MNNFILLAGSQKTSYKRKEWRCASKSPIQLANVDLYLVVIAYRSIVLPEKFSIVLK